MSADYLSMEWKTLQQQYDSYEKFSLLIKLVAIVLTVVSIGLHFYLFVSVLIIAVLWLQDGIWKTFQGRFEARLLVIEKALQDNHNQTGCQFNTAYQATAHSGLALITEYLKQALRPTVMYPYIALIALMLLSPYWV